MSRSSVLAVLVAAVLVSSVARAAPPALVSPQGMSADRCPTFSWSAVAGAAAYELVIYGVSAEGTVGKAPLLAVRLPAGAAAWTPPSGSCLAAGGRYAWTLRALGKGDGSWSEPALFEVEAGPSLQEVEAAIATLRRYLAEAPGGRASSEEAGPSESAPGAARGRRPRTEFRGSSTAEGGPPGGAATLWSAGAQLGNVTAASVPALGTPSVTVDANMALGAASNLFKDGSVFLWDDTTGNTALGRLALASATGTADHNTAVGRGALRYTTGGVYLNYGSYNTAVGDGALRSNTTGYSNTACGYGALVSNTAGYTNTASGSLALSSNTIGSQNTASGYYALFSNTTGYSNTGIGALALSSNTTGLKNTASGFRALDSNTMGSQNTASGFFALSSNTTGFQNTASGSYALFSNTTGSFNTAVGRFAGYLATTGSDNIFLGSGANGASSSTHTIQIGGGTGTGVGEQNRTFIAGIRGITTALADAVPVLIASDGQLGTASSSREVKQDIRAIGELSRRLLELRPVAFRYRQHTETDPETPLQFGLIAEEVAEVFPELVVRDAEGKPETVKYHLLAALLLNELQLEHQLNEAQEAELARQRNEVGALRDRLEARASGGAPEERPAPWCGPPGDG